MTEQNTKQKTTIAIAMSAFVLLVVIAAFTYAYFTANTIVGNNLIITANVSDAALPIFTAYSSGDLEVMVTTSDMLDTGAESTNTIVADSDTQVLYVNLIGGSSNEPVTCTFDIYWENTGANYVPSANVTSDLKEFTLKISDPQGNTVMNETRVDTLQSNVDANNRYVVSQGQSITSTGSLTEKKYIVMAQIYNLNVVQTIYNSAYSSRISVTNIEC